MRKTYKIWSVSEEKYLSVRNGRKATWASWPASALEYLTGKKPDGTDTESIKLADGYEPFDLDIHEFEVVQKRVFNIKREVI